ncbi:uncharacterized protein BP5553_08710 [Venustampulla echinocandica]|uniref:Non-homologous end-joining factor 1 n=1 Tax=Venustampulla echinocandica TaxID=2656787 RepID=A0A370TF25_9HELO|nr:uncharacterized protein BP5553_08710 [Venustampulla echinocandica]RDL33271.1 hypothetical protein BP5553_08710 [Venustampulla echinocandica]
MAWKPLELSPSASAYLPPFLLSAAFDQGARSYTIHLTDLTHIWSESLSRSDIVRRSQEEGTSIDPSDDDQLHILLEKIKLGLERGNDTTSALTINLDDDRPVITLNLTVQLPGGLAPLEWPVQLSPAPQSLLTGQLTLPLLGAQQARMQELASIADLLKEKDHAIQKLLDKLESQGTDLAQVFPQAAGKHGRKLDRRGAEERVKGLKPFSLQAWRQALDTNKSHDPGQLISHVFAADGADALRIEAGEDQGSSAEGWWDNIKGITVNLESGKVTTNFSRPKPRKVTPPPKQKLPAPSRAEQSLKRAPKDQDGNASQEVGDFQVQSTPPHLRSKEKSPFPKPTINESTDSENDDLDAPSQRSKIPDSVPASQPPPRPAPPTPSSRKPKRLGAVGGKKSAPKPAVDEDITTEDDSSLPQKTPSRFDTTGDKKAKSKPLPRVEEGTNTEDEASPPRHLSKKSAANKGRKAPPKSSQAPAVDHDASTEDDISSPRNSSPDHQTPSAEISPKPAKGVLGKIGGKKRPPHQVGSSPPLSSGEKPTPTPVTPTKPKRGKLGQIGGKKKSKVEEDISIGAAVTEADESTHEKTPRKAKLGVIGKLREPKASTPIQHDASDEEVAVRGRRQVKEERPTTPEPRETSIERADKKRAQLKRELEEKAKAPPARKKRKF